MDILCSILGGSKLVPGLWIFITSIVILTVVLFYTLGKRRTLIGRAFLFLLVCAWIWTAAFILELVSTTLEMKLLFAKIQFIGIVLIPVAWLHFALVHVGRRLKIHFWILIFLIVALSFVFILLVPMPNLFWGYPSLIPVNGAFNVVDYDYGPLFTYVLMPFTNILILSSLGLLVHLFLEHHTLYKKQTLLIIVGTSIPLVMNILYIFGITPVTHLNYSTASLSITGVLFGYALFKFRYLDVYPLARDIIFEQMQDPVLVLNERKVIIDANRAAIGLVPVSVDLVGSDYHKLESLYFHEGLMDSLSDTGKSGPEDSVAIESRLFDVTVKQVEDIRGQGGCTIILFHDVTERENLHRKIEELGRRDPLTGVFNRRELISHIEQLYEEAYDRRLPLSLLMLDIDSFKQVNDTYGHDMGDRALETFAKVLFHSIQPTDIVGRYGGDEFIIVSLGTSLDRAIVMAEEIRREVSLQKLPTTVGDMSLRTSIGVKTFDFVGEKRLSDPATKFLAEVDEVLYIAKRKGKNRISY